jgi:hypothetical protein
MRDQLPSKCSPIKCVMRLVTVAATLLPFLGASAFQTTPTAFIRNSEVYARPAGASEAIQLTNDGLAKRLLVQSKSGERIAFVRDSPVELADIVVIRPDGSGTREIHFRPLGGNILGMRFVEGLDWISEQRLIVSGSLNPSTCEYAVIDVETGASAGGYLTDGFSLSESLRGWEHTSNTRRRVFGHPIVRR